MAQVALVHRDLYVVSRSGICTLYRTLARQLTDRSGPIFMTDPRMLTDDGSTGKLHLGHYVRSIANRVKLHRSQPRRADHRRDCTTGK